MVPPLPVMGAVAPFWGPLGSVLEIRVVEPPAVAMVNVVLGGPSNGSDDQPGVGGCAS